MLFNFFAIFISAKEEELMIIKTILDLFIILFALYIIFINLKFKQRFRIFSNIIAVLIIFYNVLNVFINFNTDYINVMINNYFMFIHYFNMLYVLIYILMECFMLYVIYKLAKNILNIYKKKS